MLLKKGDCLLMIRIAIGQLRGHRDPLSCQPVVTGALVIDQVERRRAHKVCERIETADGLTRF